MVRPYCKNPYAYYKITQLQTSVLNSKLLPKNLQKDKFEKDFVKIFGKTQKHEKMSLFFMLGLKDFDYYFGSKAESIDKALAFNGHTLILLEFINHRLSLNANFNLSEPEMLELIRYVVKNQPTPYKD